MRDAAEVVEFQALRYRAACRLVGEPMDKDTHSVNLDLGVPPVVQVSTPQPAPSRGVGLDLGGDALGQVGDVHAAVRSAQPRTASCEMSTWPLVATFRS